MLLVEIEKQLRSMKLELGFEHSGGITILFGRSGAGKTTTLQAIAGMMRPDRGRISLHGRTLYSSSERTNVPIWKRSIGYIFQQHNLFPHMTGLENVRYGARDEAEVGRWLEDFGVGHLADRYPARMSGGERQRIAIIRALVSRPKLLLLDEPLSAVDVGMRHVLLDQLRALYRATGVPMLYVTHNESEAFRLGDRILVIEEGRLIHDGPPAEVVKTPTSVTLAALCGTENVLTGVVAEHRVAEDVTELKVGEVVLRVPLCRGEVGSAAVVAVRPEDILLSLKHVSGTSARNQLPGRIVEVEHDRFPIVKIKVDGGPVLRARITRGSLERLGLEPGARLHLLIKTWAFHLVDVGSPVAADGS